MGRGRTGVDGGLAGNLPHHPDKLDGVVRCSRRESLTTKGVSLRTPPGIAQGHWEVIHLSLLPLLTPVQNPLRSAGGKKPSGGGTHADHTFEYGVTLELPPASGIAAVSARLVGNRSRVSMPSRRVSMTACRRLPEAVSTHCMALVCAAVIGHMSLPPGSIQDHPRMVDGSHPSRQPCEPTTADRSGARLPRAIGQPGLHPVVGGTGVEPVTPDSKSGALTH